MVKVQCDVTTYEIDGKELAGIAGGSQLRVCSHWNREALVVLEFNGNKITVAARELQAAIANATNTGK